MQSLLCNPCYAIFAMQSLLCNLSYATFAMQSLLTFVFWDQIAKNNIKFACLLYFAGRVEKPLVLLCFCNHNAQKHYKTCVFLQYFAEHVEKPLVLLCFCNQSAQKPYKTYAFCNILLNMLKNHWFYCVFATNVLKNLIKPVFFAIFCWTCWKTMCFTVFLQPIGSKTL